MLHVYAAVHCKMFTRKDLSLSEKVAILDRIHSQPKGTSHWQLAEMLKVPKTTIGRLLRQEAELRAEFREKGKGRVSLRFRKAQTVRKESRSGRSTRAVVRGCSPKGGRISGPILKSRAEELAQKLGRTDFVATDGWLSRWKSRQSMKFKHAHCEKGSADVEGAEE